MATAGDRALPGVVHGERSIRVAASSCALGQRRLVKAGHIPATARHMLHARRTVSTVLGAHGMQSALERIALWATCGG